MKSRILFITSLLSVSISAGAKEVNETSSAPRLAISLAQAETAALSYAPRLKAAAEQIAASRDHADSARAGLLPRLTLDGNYRYVTDVPEVPLPPGAAPLPFRFGSHHSYSIGPSLSYTLWDENSLRKGWKSQLAIVRSQEDAEALAGNQVLLGVRLAYFQLQLALEQVTVVGDSLNLAVSQYGDIHKRLSAGAATRVDALSAHQQVLSRRRNFRQAQTDLASSLRELFTLIGSTASYDLAHPMNGRVNRPVPADAGATTLLLELDPLTTRPDPLALAAARDFDNAHPTLRAYASQADAARLNGDSLAASEWPKFQLSARSSYDYPNLPLLESVWQNTFVGSVSMPLYEASKTSRLAREQRHVAEALDKNRQQALDDLKKEWLDARDQWASLQDQEALDRESVSETEEIGRLKYIMYKAGSLTFIEVQAANLDALLAKVTAAQTQAQMLIRLATLDSLSEHP